MKKSNQKTFGVRNERGKKKHYPNSRLVLIMLSVIILGPLVIRIVVHEFFHQKTAPANVISQWKRYFPGDSQLSLELPGEPQLETQGVPDSMQKMLKQVRVYKYSASEFRVGITDALYVEGLRYNIEEAASGAVQALKQREGVTDYEGTVQPIERSGRAGVLINGSYKLLGRTMHIKALMLSMDSRLWQVMITYPTSNQTFSSTAQRVLGSVKLD